MPWVTPDLKTTRKLSRDLVIAYLAGADANVPNNPLRVMSDTNAALLQQSLEYLDWLALQLMVDTAETEWLDRHARIWLGGRKAASYADGSITLTGIAGTVVPVGTRWQSANGALYETIVQVTLAGSSTDVAIAAITEGEAANADAGTTLAAVDAVSGMDGTATVVLLDNGANIESDALLRDRILKRIQNPPMGGDKTDYEQWALAVPGVTRAWAAPMEMGVGTITVRFMMDETRADDDPSVSGFPLSGDVTNVQLYIDGQRPVTVKDLFVVAPVPQPINFTITGLVNDTSLVRLAISESVSAMLYERAVPGQMIYRSWVDEAISQAVGEDHHELTFSTTAMASNGHLAVLGTITYA